MPSIPEDITHLDLRRNDIQEIKLDNNTNLKYLDLSDNKIKDMSKLVYLPNLETLDLSYNLFKKISLPHLNLKELYLICNDILKMENLNLPLVEKVDIAVNNISKIENLDKCLNLRELYLGSNQIEEVNNMLYLSNLEVLDLQNNKLKEIDCSLLPRGLKKLLLSDNSELTNLINLEDLKELELLAVERTGVGRIERSGIKEVWK